MKKSIGFLEGGICGRDISLVVVAVVNLEAEEGKEARKKE